MTCCPSRVAAARALAGRLDLPYAGPDAGVDGDQIHLGPEKTEFLLAGGGAVRALSVDFLAGPLGQRLRRLGRHEPLIRAVGARCGEALTVLDATPGLGRDAIMLALWGCHVTLVERSLPIVALLEDALHRALPALEKSAGRPVSVTLECGDSRHWMAAVAPNAAPQVIFLDPMFPSRRKSSLVKQNMRILREITGNECDGAELLHVALDTALARVVVKRPKDAPPLTDRPPDHHIYSPTLRFDVYLIESPHPGSPAAS